MINEEYNMLRPYKKKQPNFKFQYYLDLWYYHDFLEHEKPFYIGKLYKKTETYQINVYKARWDTIGSISLSFYCLVYKIGYESEGYLVNVRYKYQYKKIGGKKVYHWIPILFWYKPHSDYGYEYAEEHPLITSADILDVMEQCLESHRNLDYRYKNFDNIKCPSIPNLYKKKPSFHYLIHCENTNSIKIGRAADPKHRYSQINSDTATTIRLLATIQSDYATIIDELLKDHFAHKRLKSEWFMLNKADLDRILNKKLPYPINQFLGKVELISPDRIELGSTQ